jgi:hypothetical protein
MQFSITRNIQSLQALFARIDMAYRRTRKYSAERLRAMQAGKERARMARAAPDYPADLPDLRMRITVERMDLAESEVHVFELRRSRRVDQYRVLVDGQPWRVAGLSAVLEGIRKSCPRMMSARAL